MFPRRFEALERLLGGSWRLGCRWGTCWKFGNVQNRVSRSHVEPWGATFSMMPMTLVQNRTTRLHFGDLGRVIFFYVSVAILAQAILARAILAQGRTRPLRLVGGFLGYILLLFGPRPGPGFFFCNESLSCCNQKNMSGKSGGWVLQEQKETGYGQGSQGRKWWGHYWNGWGTDS